MPKEYIPKYTKLFLMDRKGPEIDQVGPKNLCKLKQTKEATVQRQRPLAHSQIRDWMSLWI